MIDLRATSRVRSLATLGMTRGPLIIVGHAGRSAILLRLRLYGRLHEREVGKDDVVFETIAPAGHCFSFADVRRNAPAVPVKDRVGARTDETVALAVGRDNVGVGMLPGVGIGKSRQVIGREQTLE